MQAAEQCKVCGIGAVALHRVQDVVVFQAVGDAGIEVVHAISGRRVHQPRAIAVADVLGQVHGRQTLVTAICIVQRVAEVQASQGGAFGSGQHGAGQAKAL